MARPPGGFKQHLPPAAFGGSRSADELRDLPRICCGVAAEAPGSGRWDRGRELRGAGGRDLQPAGAIPKPLRPWDNSGMVPISKPSHPNKVSRVWNSLRNGLKKGESASAAKNAIPAARSALALLKRPKAEQFLQREFDAFVGAIREAGVSLLPIGEFATRYKAYCDAHPRQRNAADAMFGHFKFDIHGDIARPVELAGLLRERAVPSLFLAMHRHPINETWFGTQTMWDALNRIRDLGHEVGLHADPFHLITKYEDLYSGLDASLEEMRAHGFEIRALTLHGDSRASFKSHKLQANDFFVDEFRQSQWDGIAPEGDEGLADHVRKYKHRKLFKRFGIEYVADVNFVERGKLITRGSMMYLSDNQRRIRVGNIVRSIVPSGVLEAPEMFAIPPAFAGDAARVLGRRPFLALFHPQWYA